MNWAETDIWTGKESTLYIITAIIWKCCRGRLLHLLLPWSKTAGTHSQRHSLRPAKQVGEEVEIREIARDEREMRWGHYDVPHWQFHGLDFTLFVAFLWYQTGEVKNGFICKHKLINLITVCMMGGNMDEAVSYLIYCLLQIYAHKVLKNTINRTIWDAIWFGLNSKPTKVSALKIWVLNRLGFDWTDGRRYEFLIDFSIEDK